MEHLISISEMAKLHGISRQTLIHYDRIGLFKPNYTDSRGYRYYSRKQIPFLRKICFLKAMGISLKDITDYIYKNNIEDGLVLLRRRKQEIIDEIAELNTMRKRLQQQISLFEETLDVSHMNMQEPFIMQRAERQIIYQPYIQPISRENLHLTLMTLWRDIFAHKLLPSAGFGSFFTMEAVKSGHPLDGAYSCIFVPVMPLSDTPYTLLPAGEYACLYKYGMPYETKHIEKLMAWIDENDYEICGDVVDTCLLDTTLYQKDQDADFCLLEIPIKPKHDTHSDQTLTK